MKGRIQSVEVSLLVHATEDMDKLAVAVERLVGVKDPEVQELEGHFGNKILHLTYRVTGESAARVFDEIASGLGTEARRVIKARLGSMVDEHSALFLRLDKQALVGGELELGERDPVRVRIKPRLFLLKDGGEAFYREALGKG